MSTWLIGVCLATSLTRESKREANFNTSDHFKLLNKTILIGLLTQA